MHNVNMDCCHPVYLKHSTERNIIRRASKNDIYNQIILLLPQN